MLSICMLVNVYVGIAYICSDNGVSMSYGGGGRATGATTNGGAGSNYGGSGDGDYFGMIFGSGAAPTQLSPPTTMLLLSLLIILTLYITTNHGGSLSLTSLSL